MHKGHKTLIKFLLVELHILDLLRNVNKISLRLLFVQNIKSTNQNRQKWGHSSPLGI